MRPSDNKAHATTVPGLNSPLILDSDMEGGLQDTGFGFFNSAFMQDSPAGTSHFLDDDFLSTSPSQNAGSLGSEYRSPTKVPNHTVHALPSSYSEDEKRSLPVSAPSSISPDSSAQDSSSDTSRRHKRKSSSNSSHSALIADAPMMDDAELNDWKTDDITMGEEGGPFGPSGHGIPFMGMASGLLSLDSDFETSNKAMENHFDFESAASSPSPMGAGETAGASPRGPATGPDVRYRVSPGPATKITPNKSSSRPSQKSLFYLPNSREASPLSAMVTSQESSPSALFNAQSPGSSTGGDFSTPMFSGSPQNMQWPMSFDFATHAPPSLLQNPGLHPSLASQIPASSYLPIAPASQGTRTSFTVHPTPLKSRVETQIPIKLTLYPLPPGVTKLHLPTHTISKPKLLAKAPYTKSPDTLELRTMLVCTSAMQCPENLHRALARAAGDTTPIRKQAERRCSSGDPSGSEDDESRPLNGGEVKICTGCMTRERKRAARKKIKKIEEEESWLQDEDKRVIVFNTQEVKEWHEPSNQIESTDQIAPHVPAGAMQVDAPMRIACYCRHQNEKLGFQVIFTVKDHEDHVIAQAITSSIMITDDHKTHTPPALPTHPVALPNGPHLPGAGVFSSGQPYEMPPAHSEQMMPFRLSHSNGDLQSMPNMMAPTPQHTNSMPLPPQSSQNTSATLTPRNFSRQASPSASNGPTAKKRKSSGSCKVPSGLAMTRLDTSPPSSTNHNGPNAGNLSQSPFSLNPQSVPSAADQSFLLSIPPQYNAGPPTPSSSDQGFMSTTHRSQSMENLPMQTLFSNPGSAHQSRPPSPGPDLRGNPQAFQQSQAQMAQAVANSYYGVPLALNPHRPPTIHKLIPNEGPKAGGIEVTCLGSGFCQGLEVMFGDALATTTTYWGDTSLVCLLPPAVQAGTVAVTFKHQHQQMQPFPTPPIAKQQAFFKYIDDDEHQLLRLALSVLGHKMTGQMEDVRDVARRIVGSGPNPWASGAGGSTQGGGQNRGASTSSMDMLGMMDTESSLLKCLDLIDLDDSPRQPRLNLRQSSGQTMLHLACAVGYTRFVAALLARGANPDPRDKGGFTPMMFAAMHNHSQIVRRLVLNGADPTLRTLQGFTAADLSGSEPVLQSTRRVRHHARTRSAGATFMRSRAGSVASVRSVWDSPPPTSRDGPATSSAVYGSDSSENEGEDADEDDSDESGNSEYWAESRRNSAFEDAQIGPSKSSDQMARPATASGSISPAVGMAAWRDQLAAHIHHIQQNVHLNLPSIQIPALPGYQANPMVQRISSLVPHRTSRSSTSGNNEAQSGQNEGNYRWWELFTPSSTAPPPAYEEIYPHEDQNDDTRDLNVKKSSAMQAAADAILDQQCSKSFDSVVAESSSAAQASASTTSRPSSPDSIDVRIGKTSLTPEQQERLRMAHARKMKRIRSDRNLFFIWVSHDTSIPSHAQYDSWH
ncbi:MAG: hypothetical protein M1819_001608 [Sarea resinae]|nr:MAG: hypothetical protein M1819_001608 [Sarea resinae]